MNAVPGIERPPLGFRLLHKVQKEPDWSTITDEELITYRDAANRKAAARFSRVITGFPDRRATIRWQEVTLPDRTIRVRVYRPTAEHATALPLVLHVHGGGFVGTAPQCDWANSYFAARLPAIVVSVEHRLLAPGSPLSAAVDDGWDVLCHLVQHAAEWGIDPARIAVAGESTGALIAALTAIRAKAAGLPLRAQVLTNPVADVTDSMFDYPSMVEHANSPGLTVVRLRLFRKLAVPEAADAHAVSPLHTTDLSGLAPALVVVPTIDPVADHGRRYAQRLGEFGTPARRSEHRGAPHAFLALPGVVPQAKAARAEITEFLDGHLAESQSTARPSKATAR
ncbi:alpha/beta hydrolase [Nocardia suismassiliense]|uniref:alpha/beta hydrolase n=1 Tax=Nocardia suismassiliense TaxID=2077092 RepID=UPI000D1F4355|nr:alpha/beta hydrolase [Nocardia suismassiliense]